MKSDPLVAVDETDARGWYVVTCSECGELAHGGNRVGMARVAHRHAEDVHDGLVEREGWT